MRLKKTSSGRTCSLQLVHDRPIERGLLLRARDVEEDQLNEDAVLGSVDTEVVGVEQEVLRLVFRDGLKSILGHSQAFDHLVVHDVCDGAAVFRRLALDEVDSGERHGGGPFPALMTEREELRGAPCIRRGLC
jgi:hypothetical protein